MLGSSPVLVLQISQGLLTCAGFHRHTVCPVMGSWRWLTPALCPLSLSYTSSSTRSEHQHCACNAAHAVYVCIYILKHHRSELCSDLHTADLQRSDGSFSQALSWS